MELSGDSGKPSSPLATPSSDDEMPTTDVPDFYDSCEDDTDAHWILERRQGRVSDAILSCPACLNTCCVDCQQHCTMPEKFRAMFVIDCRVDHDSVELLVEDVPHTVGKRKKRPQNSASSLSPEVDEGIVTNPVLLKGENIVHPFFCDNCGQRLGVFDKDEVYHFESPVPSQA